jgi:hypothetical protein
MKSATFQMQRKALFLGQLRLVPKVGQRGQLSYKDIRLYKIIQLDTKELLCKIYK